MTSAKNQAVQRFGRQGLIDTHAHLDHQWYDGERDAVVLRALDAGVTSIVTIGADMRSSEEAVRLAEAYPSVYATVGIHPHDAASATATSYERLRELSAHPRVVAIGEIGLDYHYDHSPRAVQRDVFIRQLALARETGLPFVVHNREADEDVMAILREYGRDLPGLLHAFTGDAKMAGECVSLGYFISVGGMVTFKNAGAIREAIAAVPLERLLLETDAPYLTPVPLRGKRNEPAYVTYVAEFLAAERGVDVAEIARVTTDNARRFFRLPAEAAGAEYVETRVDPGTAPG